MPTGLILHSRPHTGSTTFKAVLARKRSAIAFPVRTARSPRTPTKPLSEARQNARPGHTQSRTSTAAHRRLNNDEAPATIRAGLLQLPCGRRTVAVRRRCLVAGSLRGAGSARRGKGHPGRREPSGRRERRERSGRQARQGRRAWPGRQEASAPHSGHTVSGNWAFAPHFGHVLSISTAAGLKHMVDPFSFPTNTARAARPASGTSPHRGGPPRSTGGNARTEAARLSGA